VAVHAIECSSDTGAQAQKRHHFHRAVIQELLEWLGPGRRLTHIQNFPQPRDEFGTRPEVMIPQRCPMRSSGLVADRLPLRHGIQCEEPKISSALSETSTRPSDQMLGLSPFRVISTSCRFLRVLVTLWKVSIFRLSSRA
jgi:hypothetical protein